ncbi:MAG TPA: hypothetical protein VIT44_14595 [Cyclobacteriaceae bacterium]
MATQKIYIHLVDGTDVWVAIDARPIQDSQFEIIEDDEYSNRATNELFEFFPGDIVEIEEQVLLDGIKRQVAKKLISKGQWTDRKFKEFKYKAGLKKLPIDKQTAELFRKEIERVKKEYSSGQIFYPTIMETVSKLESLIE